jgi:hypothetical protein
MTAGFLESKMSAPDVFCPRSTAGIGPSTGGDAIKIAIGRLDCARRYRLRGVAVEKVRLDRPSRGEWRVEVTIVHELVEFGTIPGNAQTF